MTVATPQPRRRRWKRWAIVGALTVATLLISVPAIIRSTDLTKARRLRIGQTRAEVLQIMGRPPMEADAIAFSTTYRLLEPVRRWAFNWFGYRTREPDFNEFLVTVSFDAHGRVDRIKRGSEIIEAPPVSQTK